MNLASDETKRLIKFLAERPEEYNLAILRSALNDYLLTRSPEHKNFLIMMLIGMGFILGGIDTPDKIESRITDQFEKHLDEVDKHIKDQLKDIIPPKSNKP